MPAATTQLDGSSTDSGPVRPDPARRIARTRTAAALVVAGIAFSGLAACSSDAPTAQDAYRLGCPAIDAAVTGSGAAKNASIKALETIRDSGQLDPQPTEFLQSAIKALQSSSLKDLPADTRKSLVTGCKEAGFPLKNL